MKNWFQTSIFVLMLVVLPTLSWYYLKKGENYQLQLRAELKDYGQLPSFTLQQLLGNGVLKSDELKDHVVIVKEVSAEELNQPKDLIFALETLHTQFNERQDVVLLLHSKVQDADKIGALLRQHKLVDATQILVTSSNPDLINAYKFPEQGMMGIVDTTGTIRRYYHYRDGRELLRLTEHITVLMHRDRKNDPYLKREKEK